MTWLTTVLYKSFIGVCKFKSIDYKNKHGDNCSHLMPSNFKSILHERKIELPSYDDFKNGKNIVFNANGFSTKAVDRYQNVRNNIAPIMASIDETIEDDI